VVLFDEVEKAHPDVFNVLLQVLDDGRITDSQGRTVDFKNTIIILTSNLGSQYLLEGIQSDGEISDEAKEQVETLLKRSFRPEFLNRLDEIVFYKPLTRENITGIIDLLMADLNRRLEDKQLSVRLTEEAKQLIIDESYDPAFGARPLRRYVQHSVETLLARKILAADVAPETELVVDASEGTLFVSEQSVE
jgi:ATP-dependent Clp protease ATP-binding subunit ClpB